ncbi:hypothetical protein BKA56DRAFT_612002 [Ilyonectria sp. MPI-CAGE-AT-0026]|nr:hypothetical protein BKA56DRAFT_612002 [Ilyonectria sp. MPI-CAGE-AT-0026]
MRSHPSDKASAFSPRIVASVKNAQPRGIETLRELVQAICLRRTKGLIADELKLPAYHEQICEVAFTDEERRLCDVLKKSYAAVLDDEKATVTMSDASHPFCGVSVSQNTGQDWYSTLDCGHANIHDAIQQRPEEKSAGRSRVLPVKRIPTETHHAWVWVDRQYPIKRRPNVNWRVSS